MVLSGMLWAVSLLAFLSTNWFLAELWYLLLLSLLLSTPPLLYAAGVALSHWRLDANVMLSVAAIGAVHDVPRCDWMGAVEPALARAVGGGLR